MVIWIKDLKEVHLVELTVPHEDNICAAHERKEDRYAELIKSCEEKGCRGFIAASARKWMRVAGLGQKEGNTLVMTPQKTVE